MRDLSSIFRSIPIAPAVGGARAVAPFLRAFSDVGTGHDFFTGQTATLSSVGAGLDQAWSTFYRANLTGGHHDGAARRAVHPSRRVADRGARSVDRTDSSSARRRAPAVPQRHFSAILSGTVDGTSVASVNVGCDRSLTDCGQSQRGAQPAAGPLDQRGGLVDAAAAAAALRS